MSHPYVILWCFCSLFLYAGSIIPEVLVIIPRIGYITFSVDNLIENDYYY
jgi:hypothetical protein